MDFKIPNWARKPKKSMNVKTILFVENDPVALQMYRNRLEREGFHLQTAQDGLEALKALSKLTPDLVVLDMMLPRLSGSDVIKFVRAEPRLKSLPIVVFSNAPMSQLPREISAKGLTRHLIKTDSTFPMLLQTIQDLLAVASTGGPVEVPLQDTPVVQTQTGSRQAGTIPVISQEAPSTCAEFMNDALAEIPKIREHCLAYIKAPSSPASLQHLPNLYQRVRSMSANSANVGCARIALLTAAFDALLSEIMAKPSRVTPSILQTIAQAVDCLGLLLTSSEGDLAEPMPQVKVLAVDDDVVCNHVMVTTLKRAKFDAKCVEDPVSALQLMQSNHYDLIFLDVNMPNMTGFELCEKLRRIPHCKSTPVIFITAHNNFDNRKQSVLSGGHDFITKPVSPSELVLKATLHLLRNRSQRTFTPKTDTHDTAADVSINPSLPATQKQADQSAVCQTQPAAPSTVEQPPVEPAMENGQDAAIHIAALPSSEPGPEGAPAFSIATSATETGTSNVSETIPEANNLPLDVGALIAPPGNNGSHPDNIANKGSNEKFDKIAAVVVKIMFGEDTPTERNLREVRLALQHYNLDEILGDPVADPKERTQNRIP
jgi:CheY-like chemotaxis protein